LLEFLNGQLEINDEELESMLDRRQRERGMTEAQIRRISSITLSEELQQKLKEECCSICLDGFSTNMTIR